MVRVRPRYQRQPRYQRRLERVQSQAPSATSPCPCRSPSLPSQSKSQSHNTKPQQQQQQHTHLLPHCKGIASCLRRLKARYVWRDRIGVGRGGVEGCAGGRRKGRGVAPGIRAGIAPGSRGVGGRVVEKAIRGVESGEEGQSRVRARQTGTRALSGTMRAQRTHTLAVRRSTRSARAISIGTATTVPPHSQCMPPVLQRGSEGAEIPHGWWEERTSAPVSSAIPGVGVAATAGWQEGR